MVRLSKGVAHICLAEVRLEFSLRVRARRARIRVVSDNEAETVTPCTGVDAQLRATDLVQLEELPRPLARDARLYALTLVSS